MTRQAAKGGDGTEPPVPLRSRHAEATRRAVLDAARSLFGRQGYAQTSVEEIADAALVTKGAVYHHFAGKKALFRAVYDEVEADAQARALRAGDPGRPPVDQMVAMMNAYLDAALDVEIRRITLVDGPAIVGHEVDETAQQQPGYLAVRAFLGNSMADGQLIDVDPGALADLIGGLAWVAGLLIARSGDPDATRSALGPLAWQSSGRGPTLVFFAGALANHDLWRDVVTQLQDRYRWVTVDLPLGAHPRPLNAGADRSAASLARLLLECLELLDIADATVVVNDTAGGLLLLSLASGHPALGRVGRLVLTNCESYDQFPPDSLKKASDLSRRFPGLTRAMMRLQVRLQLRWPAAQRRFSSTVTANGIDRERAESFFGPAARDPGVAGDLVAAMAGFRPQLMLDAAAAIPKFTQPVLLIWGEECRFFTMAQARRLAADFPHATLVSVPGAKAWVPVDNPAAVASAIAEFVPAPVA